MNFSVLESNPKGMTLPRSWKQLVRERLLCQGLQGTSPPGHNWHCPLLGLRKNYQAAPQDGAGRRFPRQQLCCITEQKWNLNLKYDFFFDTEINCATVFSSGKEKVLVLLPRLERFDPALEKRTYLQLHVSWTTVHRHLPSDGPCKGLLQLMLSSPHPWLSSLPVFCSSHPGIMSPAVTQTHTTPESVPPAWLLSSASWTHVFVCLPNSSHLADVFNPM